MIELHDIRYAYVSREEPGDGPDSDSAHEVLKGAMLSVAEGELVALIGANGAGKSTIARIACGSVDAQRGTVLVDGSPADAEALRRRCGYVRQDPESQLVAPVVFDEVAFGPCNLGLPEDEVRDRVARSLSSCGLGGYERRLVAELSGGELQRVAIAGVLAMGPGYLVLDEVTSQLDASSRARVRRIIREQVACGCGVLSVTHDVEEIAAADRVAFLSDGFISWQGTPEEFFSNDRLLEKARLGGERLAGVLALVARRGVRFGRCLDAAELAASIRERGLLEDVAPLLELRAPVIPPSDDGTEVALGSSAAPAEAGSLVFEHTTVRYGDLCALAGLDLRCEAGRVMLLAGQSGSGKSTAAAVACGIQTTDEGTAVLAGPDGSRRPVRPGAVGLCLQRAEDQLFCDSVLEDVAFGPRNLGRPASECHSAAERALRSMGVEESLWDRSPFALSGGQRRRVALAGILAMGPEVYVLDEPTIGLDSEGREFLHGVVRGLARAGHAVLVVSHDVGEWLDVADDVAILESGLLRWHGSAREVADDVRVLEDAGVRAPLWVALRRELDLARIGRTDAA